MTDLILTTFDWVPERQQAAEIACEGMVLLDRIELSTSPLPMECSTTELQQRTGMGETCHRPWPFATLMA